MRFFISEDLYYTQTGEWIQVDENLVTIGLTDYLLHQLGEMLYVDLPDEGKLVRKGEPFLSLESVKQIHDLTSPVSGTVIEVNNRLAEEPNIFNDDPFNQGWIIKIEMDDEKDLASLMRASEYRKSLLDRPPLLQEKPLTA